ncbi:MAG: PEGA domain-containing protein [Alistipes sp.]|nr:PEGA domain-containing protein [Alistipes sp.]
MRRIILAMLLAVATLGIAAAQSDKNTLEIIESSFRPEQQGVLEKVNIDPVAKDRSQRACARIKLHVNRMTSADIDQLQVHIAGGVQQLTKKVLAYEGNGLIIEMTAKPQTRFFLRHNIYGDSNEVCLNLEGDKVYLLEAQLNQLFPITVATNMKGADVYVDNRYCNKTNDNYVLIVQDITPGEHTLRIEHAGRRVEQKILVHRDNLYFRCDVDIAEARPQFVLFELEPKNAVVMIDGEVQSTQEGFVQALLPNGAHNYRIMAKGYHEQSGSFTVDGAKVTRKFVLKADAAMVTITAGGEGAEIWVNNERKGTSPWRGQLLSGNYLFEARKAGHRTTSLPQSITSNPAEQSYTLDAPTPIVGSVTITSVPAMADVFVDGKSVGQTPLYTDLLAGEHTLELRRKEYATASQKITVTEGKTASLNITLLKVPTKTYKVGDYYNDGKKEGVVFWVDESGQHGKIVSLTESSSRLMWSSDTNEQKRLIGADDKNNGANNMAKVKQISGWESKYPAFKWCADLGEGWYLPAIEELKLFTSNKSVRDAVNQTLAGMGEKLANIGNSHWYWSSTEYNYQSSAGEFCAWGVSMYSGLTLSLNKYSLGYVRAVSAF